MFLTMAAADCLGLERHSCLMWQQVLGLEEGVFLSPPVNAHDVPAETSFPHHDINFTGIKTTSSTGKIPAARCFLPTEDPKHIEA